MRPQDEIWWDCDADDDDHEEEDDDYDDDDDDDDDDDETMIIMMMVIDAGPLMLDDWCWYLLIDDGMLRPGWWFRTPFQLLGCPSDNCDNNPEEWQEYIGKS